MRAYYIDRLRIFLIILVIFHHVAIAFGASGGWYYISSVTTTGITQLLLSAEMAVEQAFFMSLFFMISAMFMPASYDKKGFRKYITDRLIRLGIPLLVYILIIHPALVFFIFKQIGRETGTWFSFWKTIITQYPEPGPMWFVFTLVVFELVYALYRRFSKKSISQLFPGTKLSGITIVLFMIITGLVAFAIRIVYPSGKAFFGLQFGYFPLYMAMYMVGIIAARKRWFETHSLRDAWPWFILSLLAIPVMLVVMGKNADDLAPFSGGFNLQALFYAMWEPVICVGFCYFLPLLFRKYGSRASQFVLAQSGNSYTVYVIHPVMVVFFTFISERIPVTPFARLWIVLFFSVPVCFGLSHLIRKIPGIRRIL